ncbi:MAG: hypothetical protein R6X13_00120 [bacterium]
MRYLTVLLCAAAAMGGPLFDWQTTTELPRGSWRHACAATEDHLYFLGGGTGPEADCHHTAFKPDGTIDPWTATTSLPTTLGWFSAEATAGHIYVIGGWNTSGLTSAVRYAGIDSTGALGQWTATTSLPVPLYTHGGILVDSCIYVVGGAAGVGQPVVADVRFARIQPDGTLGSWTATSSLPGVTRLNGIVHHNGFIYSLGGRPVNNGTDAVYYAARNPDGTLGQWQSTTSLPAAVEGATCAAIDGRVYVVSGLTAACWSAPTNPDGSLGAWMSEASLPQARWAADGLAHAGRIYVPGGNLSSGQSTVYYSSPLVGTAEAPRASLHRALVASPSVGHGSVTLNCTRPGRLLVSDACGRVRIEQRVTAGEVHLAGLGPGSYFCRLDGATARVVVLE